MRSPVFVALFVSVVFVAVQAQGGSNLPLLSNAFGSNMVLNAGQASKIWGWTQAGDAPVEITLIRNNQVVVSLQTISRDQYWSTYISQPVSFEPASIIISSSGQKAQIDNVLFGFLFFCGGQSNMEMSVHGAYNASTEIPQGDQYPNIRLFTAGQKSYASAALHNFASIEQPWQVASSKTIGNGDWTFFSATCWFFGRDFYNRVKAPVGLMSINWGGTIVQSWSSPAVNQACQNAQPNGNPPNQPMLLYNAMIAPVMGMNFAAMLWYQGESNVGYASTYSCFFPAMIADYRKQTSPNVQDPTPFFFVQLSPYIAGINPSNAANLPALRQAQLSAFSLPKISAVTAIDGGDISSPLGNIHPRNKQALGARLASAMWRSLKGVYGVEGPAVKDTVYNATTGMIQLTFHEDPLAPIQPTLDIQPAICPNGVDPSFCVGFEVQFSDNSWRSANPVVVNSGYGIWLSFATPAGTSPVRVRYAWSPWPLASLFDNKGFPGWPFDRQLTQA